jgi:hypothetical protein
MIIIDLCSNSGVAQMERTAPKLASNGVQIKLDRLCVGLIPLSNATPSLGNDQRPQRRETPKDIPGCWAPQAPRLHEEHDADAFPTFSPSLLPPTHIHPAIYLDDYRTHCQTAPLYVIRGPCTYCLPYPNWILPIAAHSCLHAVVAASLLRLVFSVIVTISSVTSSHGLRLGARPQVCARSASCL